MPLNRLPENRLSENRPVIIALVVVGLAMAGLGAWYVMTSEPEPAVQQPLPIPAPAPKPAVEPEPEPEIEVISEPQVVLPDDPPPEPAFVLPRLDDSDQLIRDGIVGLTRHEGINAWVTPNELIRKFVAFVDGIANGMVVADPVRMLAPQGPFLAKQVDEGVYQLDPASYDRYNLVTEIVTSVNARRSAEFFVLIRPLLQDAYSELGYGDREFDDTVFSAIGRLLETPTVNEPPRLTRPVVMYEFEDQRLENLSPAQKQLIRMGPRNTRLIQAKLSELALELRSMLEKN